MDDANTIAELRRQLEEQRQLREEAERRLEPNTLVGLLDRCHRSLSKSIQIETNATLTTQGTVTDPVNRLYPKRILPWLDFPRLQEEVWAKLEGAASFASRPLFPSNHQLDYVAANIQDKPIYSEASLRNFQRDTVENFVEMIIEALRADETLGRELCLHGRVAFYDRANPSESTGGSLEESLEHMHVDDALPSRRQRRGRGRGRKQAQQTRPARRRNRRADQFCVHVISNERQVPAYVVEFKAPHKLTEPELVAGLHEVELERDVIGKEGDTFEFLATLLVSAVVTQIVSYMFDTGVRNGYICTGEAYVFLHIPEDPTVVLYHLCIPNKDVQADDEHRLHRTAVGQVLAFTLQALAAETPSQEWFDSAHEKLSTWEVEYLDVLRDIPETIRSKDPPPSVYRPSSWTRSQKSHNTRSRARCKPGQSTPRVSSSEGGGSDEEPSSPSATAAARSRSSRGKESKSQALRKTQGRNAGQGTGGSSSQKRGQIGRPFCTMACIRGMAYGGALDRECPNSHDQGAQGHSINARVFMRKLHDQLSRNRNEGFEPLHIRGRTGYLMKATLLEHGYTVLIKATIADKAHHLRTEAAHYRYLRRLQGHQIPVCVGNFKPRVSYWYQGEPMAHMMILSWSGTRLQHVINEGNQDFFNTERARVLGVLHSNGVVHRDTEWRNMLWNDQEGTLVVIDLEDVERLKRARPLGASSGNRVPGKHRLPGRKVGQVSSQSAAICV